MFYKYIIFSLYIFTIKSFKKIFNISIAIFKNQVSGYPEYVINFENKFKKYVGKKYALTFSNGTSALKSAIFSLGIDKKYKFLVPEYTFHATIDPVFNLGYEITFVKVNRYNLSIDIDDLKLKVTNEIKALIVTHPFGFPANMEEVSKICLKNKILLIEDCSHSHGAKFKNEKIGKFSNISIFSLQGNKSISAGEGGIALTNSINYWKKMLIYGHFSNRIKDISVSNFTNFTLTGWGEKMRCNPLGILLAQEDLLFIDSMNNIKNKIYEYLKMNLKEKKDLFLIKKVNGSIPGGFFSGIPLIINKNLTENFEKKIKEKKIKIYLDPWIKLDDNKIYNHTFRNNIIKNRFKVINKSELVSQDVFKEFKVYLIPLPRFLNYDYKKLLKFLNSF